MLLFVYAVGVEAVWQPKRISNSSSSSVIGYNQAFEQVGQHRSRELQLFTEPCMLSCAMEQCSLLFLLLTEARPMASIL